MKVTVNQANV